MTWLTPSVHPRCLAFDAEIPHTDGTTVLGVDEMTSPRSTVASIIAGACAITALGAAMVATALTAIPATASIEILADIALPH